MLLKCLSVSCKNNNQTRCLRDWITLTDERGADGVTISVCKNYELKGENNEK